MADTAGQADIRGLDVDKVAKGFADKMFMFKQLVQVSSTSSREIRWYQKGVSYNPLITGTTTTGITASPIANTSDKSLFPVAQQSWTRNTSYVRKYAVESETISEEDIGDSDVDVLMTNVRDLVKAVANQVDTRIFDVLSESLSPSLINTTAATGTGWDDGTNGDPVLDLLTAKQKISANHYDISSGLVCVMNSVEHKNLVHWLIDVKGSSIPNFSSEKVGTGVVQELLGFDIVVSETATTDYALQFIRGQSATWKQFTPTSSVVIDEPGIGKKVRVWERGECILTDPKSVHLTTDTVT